MRRLYFVFCVILFVSCASIPKETPQLSQELGAQISALQTSHLALLHKFFAAKRTEIRDFVDKEWSPKFIENFFAQPPISEAWQKVVDSEDPQDRMEFITRVMPEIQHQTQKEYTSLIAPINALETELEAAVRQKYSTALNINQTLTAYLESASNVAGKRREYLGKIGIDQSDIDAVIDTVDQLTRQALQGAENAEDIKQQLEDYKQQLEDLLDDLHIRKSTE